VCAKVNKAFDVLLLNIYAVVQQVQLKATLLTCRCCWKFQHKDALIEFVSMWLCDYSCDVIVAPFCRKRQDAEARKKPPTDLDKGRSLL
jgi:hypothetical protein